MKKFKNKVSTNKKNLINLYLHSICLVNKNSLKLSKKTIHLFKKIKNNKTNNNQFIIILKKLLDIVMILINFLKH